MIFGHIEIVHNIIKVLTALVGRLSQCRLEKIVLNGDFQLTLDFLYFKQTVLTLTRCVILWHLIWVWTVCQCPSPGFTDNRLYTALWRHSDKNSAAINNRYLGFRQSCSLISLVSDNHMDNMDNNHKEMLVYMYVYFGSIVNKQPQNESQIRCFFFQLKSVDSFLISQQKHLF